MLNLQVKLPPKASRDIARLIASGRYKSVHEVLTAATRQLVAIEEKEAPAEEPAEEAPAEEEVTEEPVEEEAPKEAAEEEPAEEAPAEEPSEEPAEEEEKKEE